MSRFSDIVMEHFQEPRNRGALPDKTHQGIVGRPGEGPYFVLNLLVSDEVVQQATFECNSCGFTIASGSVLTEWLIGKSLVACSQVTVAQLADLLGGLPPHKQHCPHNAVHALHQALHREPVLPQS